MVAGGLALAALALGACQPAVDPTNPPTTPGTERVVVFGDSIPDQLFEHGSAKGIDARRFTAIDGSLSACDSSLPFYYSLTGSGAVVPATDACKRGWRKQYPPFLQTRPDVVAIMGGMHAMLDHRIAGVWTHPCDPVARTWYREDIKARLTYLVPRADRVVVVLPAWPGPKGRFVYPEDYVARADCVRQELVAAASARGVPTVDLGAHLCPTAPDACGPTREGDGVHIDRASAPAVLAWLLSALVAA